MAVSTATEGSVRSDGSLTSPVRSTPSNLDPDRPQVAQIVAEDTLVGRWPFQSGFVDIVGGNDANPATGQPGIADIDGRLAAVFDGDDALRISRSEHGELDLMGSSEGPATFATWVYFDAESGDRPFGNPPAGQTLLRNDTGYRITGHGAAADQEGVIVQFGISPYGGSPASNYSMPDRSGVTVPLDEWHHVAVVVEPTERVALYLDGEREFVDSEMDGFNEPSSEPWTDISVGGAYGGDPEQWHRLLNGCLSDLRVYGTGLSDEQVAHLAGERASQSARPTDAGRTAEPPTDDTDPSPSTDTAGLPRRLLTALVSAEALVAVSAAVVVVLMVVVWDRTVERP